ncbi:MAG: putA, partial [Gammaproteobacteria bacterium]|nr:putA [Gammaproteobacteria bacterium]
LTGKVTSWRELKTNTLGNVLKRLVQRSGEPVIRHAVSRAMKILGHQFVMGRTMEEALARAREQEAKGYRYSYDMLGEAARTEADAKRYFDAYLKAISEMGQASQKGVVEGPGISIKLSALHPRYEIAQYERVFPILRDRLKTLAIAAKEVNIGLTIDAEEANRLDFSLNLIEAVFSDNALSGWEGFGLALQSYQKRGFYVIDCLAQLAKQHHRRLMVRLIKGAYWDAEIKDSQVNGYEGYPVFTRKMATDVSYIACAKKLLSYGKLFYPQFATHNAQTVATVLHLVENRRDFEFQCLHGMGQALYNEIVDKNKYNIPCRVYAPVGSHEDLLPYLVRRLLENGANTSFVNRIVDESVPIARLTQNPIKQVSALKNKPHPAIPLPKNLYGKERENSTGCDLANPIVLAELMQSLTILEKETTKAASLIEAAEEEIEEALFAANKAAETWSLTPVAKRAECLEKMANLLQDNRERLISLLTLEAAKTIPDSISEVREAIDFCRYYAMNAKQSLEKPELLRGPTGEYNHLGMHGRGPILCISPWNFPLAIFIGQIAAALAAGNPVLAKPAEQTPLIAYLATSLFYEAGIAQDVLQLLVGRGETVGARLVADLRIKGVMFTGSTQTARRINQVLANREGPIIPLIAETGGQNVMITDSTALPEQVVRDAVQSAFGSAGQRCSALRVLYVQEEVADKIMGMLQGAMAELQVGDPTALRTDVGPVIDADALSMLETHYDFLSKEARLIYQVPLSSSETSKGYFFAPCAFEIKSLSQLSKEVFGPCLHVIRYDISKLDDILRDIEQSGYGLTLGIHSRIESRIQYISNKVHVGNIYVNRNMIGAVVGVQPFGGEGLSGTGPKAGGPHYLSRLSTERTLSVDTTASGGNASLMMLNDAEE